MTDLKAAANEFNQLRGQWQAANQEARAARAKVTGAYAACAAGKGAGPTLEQIEACDQLERTADALAIDMQTLVKKALG